MLRGTVTYVNSPEATAKQMRAAVKEGLAEIPINWQGKYLPEHFKAENMDKYGIADRDPEYNDYKQKRYGHTRPLEFSGHMKKKVMRRIKVTSTAKGARGVLSGPKHLYAHRPLRGQPNKAAELVSTTVPEAKNLAHVLDRTIQKILKSKNKREVKRF